MPREGEAYFYAFDFDGVLCDSARETGTAGLAALKSLTPDRHTVCDNGESRDR